MQQMGDTFCSSYCLIGGLYTGFSLKVLIIWLSIFYRINKPPNVPKSDILGDLSGVSKIQIVLQQRTRIVYLDSPDFPTRVPDAFERQFSLSMYFN